MVKITNLAGDVKIGRQGEVVYQRKYGEQIRRGVSPKRAIASKAQIAHRQLYRDALDWRHELSLPNRRYLERYTYANGVVDSYHNPLGWSKFALKLYLEKVKFEAELETEETPPVEGEKKDASEADYYGFVNVGKTYRMIQSFIPLETYKLGRVVLCICKYGDPGTARVSIRYCDTDIRPVGTDLAYADFNANELSHVTPYIWKEIELDGLTLEEGVRYCVHLSAQGAGTGQYVRWSRTQYNTPYPRGRIAYTGADWDVWTDLNVDSRFIIYSAGEAGTKYRAGTLHVKHPALSIVVHKRGEAIVQAYEGLSSLDEEYLTGQVGLDVEADDFIEATTLPGVKYSYLVK